jgi:hypothetical protein
VRVEAAARKDEFARHEGVRSMAPAKQHARLGAVAAYDNQGRGIAWLLRRRELS